MALTLPLHVVASVQRCCSNHAGTSNLPDQIIDLIVNRSSLFDVIKWQQISKSFQKAAQKRLDMYTMIDIKVYNGLEQLRYKSGIESEYDWHPSLALMIMELEPNHLGIAIDSELKANTVTALLHLLFTLRRKVEQLFIDSPIIELLVAQINKEQIHMLIEMVSLSRKVNCCCGGTRNRQLKLTPLHRTYFPDANQLQHLSRLLSYAVSVDLLYHVEQMDLLCLKILVGNVWARPTKFRLFRHLTKFRRWTEADMLGERYFQQFGTIRKRSRSSSYA
ncbi:hypothetical protein DINM_001290 [Dirofilaria immitis]|nr:hypothetical protein [Dirofilaria immitis]